MPLKILRRKNNPNVIAGCLQSDDGSFFSGYDESVFEVVELDELPVDAIDEQDYLKSLKPWVQNREQEYIEQGITIDSLIIALWEKTVEGRGAEAQRLQEARELIKLRNPKQEAKEA